MKKKKRDSKTHGRDLCNTVLSRISIHISLNAKVTSWDGARIIQNSKSNPHQPFSVSFIVPSFMESDMPVKTFVMGKEIFAIYAIIFMFSLFTFHQPHKYGSFLCAAVIPSLLT